MSEVSWTDRFYCRAGFTFMCWIVSAPKFCLKMLPWGSKRLVNTQAFNPNSFNTTKNKSYQNWLLHKINFTSLTTQNFNGVRSLINSPNLNYIAARNYVLNVQVTNSNVNLIPMASGWPHGQMNWHTLADYRGLMHTLITNNNFVTAISETPANFISSFITNT